LTMLADKTPGDFTMAEVDAALYKIAALYG
jgi:hypothetical protein